MKIWSIYITLIVEKYVENIESGANQYSVTFNNFSFIILDAHKSQYIDLYMRNTYTLLFYKYFVNFLYNASTKLQVT